MPAVWQQGCSAGFLKCRNGFPFAGTGVAADLWSRLRRGVLLMANEAKSIPVQVFAAPSVPHGMGITWETATDFLRKRLQHRFGGTAEIEHIEMFTPRSFEFPDVLDLLGRGGGLPIVRVGGQIVSQGEKLSEHRISAAISTLLQSDRRQS